MNKAWKGKWNAQPNEAWKAPWKEAVPPQASIPTVKRLPSYLYIVECARMSGEVYISATSIAEELGLEAIQVRKDIATTGIMGKPRIGFSVTELYRTLKAFLGWDSENSAVLVGAGNLGSALMGHPAFRSHGLRIVAAIDSDTVKCGTRIHNIPVFNVQDLKKIIQDTQATIAILTVPAIEAQKTAEELAGSGIRAIWNFTNIKLKVPHNIIVQQEDLSSGYAVLSVKLAQPSE